jgi:hypothetical protein
LLDEPALTLYRDGEVRAFHNLDADWGASFTLSTGHFVDVLAGREPEEALTAQEGRRVIALYDLFQRSDVRWQSWRIRSRHRSLQGLSRAYWRRLPSRRGHSRAIERRESRHSRRRLRPSDDGFSFAIGLPSGGNLIRERN